MTVVPDHETPGLVYSIIGLSLVVPICFMFRQYFRGLDFLQMAYLFSGLMAFSSSTFSTNLSVSVVNFNHNFLTFCSAGDVVCTQGFQLSFTVCSAGLLFLLFIVVSFEKCRRPELRY
jgi:hypothetical protein